MRIHDPLKQWKLSPMDLESRRRWEEYTKAKEIMLERTHIPEAPWWIVEAVDKKKARLNCIHHLLSQMPYGEVQRAPIDPAAARAPPRLHSQAGAGGDVRPRYLLTKYSDHPDILHRPDAGARRLGALGHQVLGRRSAGARRARGTAAASAPRRTPALRCRSCTSISALITVSATNSWR